MALFTRRCLHENERENAQSLTDEQEHWNQNKSKQMAAVTESYRHGNIAFRRYLSFLLGRSPLSAFSRLIVAKILMIRSRTSLIVFVLRHGHEKLKKKTRSASISHERAKREKRKRKTFLMVPSASVDVVKSPKRSINWAGMKESKKFNGTSFAPCWDRPAIDRLRFDWLHNNEPPLGVFVWRARLIRRRASKLRWWFRATKPHCARRTCLDPSKSPEAPATHNLIYSWLQLTLLCHFISYFFLIFFGQRFYNSLSSVYVAFCFPSISRFIFVWLFFV